MDNSPTTKSLVKDALSSGGREVVENGVNDLILQPCLSPSIPRFEGKLDLPAYLITALRF